jgi:hypothetical protein
MLYAVHVDAATDFSGAQRTPPTAGLARRNAERMGARTLIATPFNTTAGSIHSC